jgi:hypothetical protein
LLLLLLLIRHSVEFIHFGYNAAAAAATANAACAAALQFSVSAANALPCLSPQKLLLLPASDICL